MEIKETKESKETNESNESKETNETIEVININVFESIKTNFLSWLFITIAIILVSYPLLKAGFITFFILLLLVYFAHKASHDYLNVFTILHHYHHDNDNFFSHFSQILVELSLGFLIVPLYYLSNKYLGNNYIDIWCALFFVLFYSTIHNINYGQFRVNKVHYLHHKSMYTNIGPDICDIAFGTKHPDSKEVENTNHYIPNVIIITMIILFIKYICDDNVKNILLNTAYILIPLMLLFITISSIYLYIKKFPFFLQNVFKVVSLVYSGEFVCKPIYTSEPL